MQVSTHAFKHTDKSWELCYTWFFLKSCKDKIAYLTPEKRNIWNISSSSTMVFKVSNFITFSNYYIFLKKSSLESFTIIQKSTTQKRPHAVLSNSLDLHLSVCVRIINWAKNRIKSHIFSDVSPAQINWNYSRVIKCTTGVNNFHLAFWMLALCLVHYVFLQGLVCLKSQIGIIWNWIS